MFVTANLMGGLGNQLFQVAHAIAISLKYNIDVKFLPYSFTPLQGNQTQNYVNNIFRKLNFVKEMEECVQYHQGPYFKYENLTFDLTKPICLNGYFQSSKNFYGYDSELQSIFQIDANSLEVVLNKHPKINDKNSISVHIRRGDYLNNLDRHPSISLEYIHHCLNFFDDLTNVYVFSDDKEWAKSNFQNYNIVDFEFDYLELWAMSLCSDNIISNSTFSWWASFLNKNKDKRVYAPSIWLGGENCDDINQPYFNIVNVEHNSYLYPKK